MDKYSSLLAEYRELETERLVLRPVSMKDARDMFEYASDEENTYFVFKRHRSLQETEIMISEVFFKAPLGKYALELKESGKMIGTIDLRVNSKHSKAEMGWTLNKAFQKQGLMTEAAEKLLELAFEVLELEKVSAVCDERNEASKRLQKRIGMVVEGISRHDRKWKNDEWINVVHQSILKEEYLARKQSRSRKVQKK